MAICQVDDVSGSLAYVLLLLSFTKSLSQHQIRCLAKTDDSLRPVVLGALVLQDHIKSVSYLWFVIICLPVTMIYIILYVFMTLRIFYLDFIHVGTYFKDQTIPNPIEFNKTVDTPLLSLPRTIKIFCYSTSSVF